MNDEVGLRPAVKSDLQEIVRLWKQNIKTTNTAADISELFNASERYFFVAVSALTTSASTEERIIGFIGGAIRGGHGHISGIAVTKEYRMREVGERLIKAVEHEFLTDSFETVTLEVRISNVGARQFYEKQGYRPSYTIKGYYADGEDALVYAKQIDTR